MARHRVTPRTPVSASLLMPASSDAPTHEGGAFGAVYTALRALGLVVLALMLVAILYAGWIAVANWGSISV